MIKETYERLFMDVTQFDAEDIITTSGESVRIFSMTFNCRGVKPVKLSM